MDATYGGATLTDLYEAILAPGQTGRVEIPDCSRDQIPGLCVRLGLRTGVEVGVYQGKHMRHWLRAGLHMTAVDPWSSRPEYPMRVGRQEEIYQDAMRRLARYTDRLTVLRTTSMDAVQTFAPGSLDVVYIDGHHGFRYIAEDVWEWSQRVRSGGIVAGHDYHNHWRGPHDPDTVHVGYVIDAFTKAMRIPVWFVLGRAEGREGERLDRWRSWMWIKP